MRPLRLALAALALLALDLPAAWAWGPIGHRAIAKIAEDHLTPQARRAVAALIAPYTLPEIAYWMDEVRPDPAWSSTAAWHWVTVEDGQTYAAASKNPAGDVFVALAANEKKLADRKAPAEERAVALKMLVHLVGDLHQPLHVGRGADAGGNKIQVTFNGAPENLHWVWDALIIRDEGLSYTELAHLLDHATAQQIRAWQSGTYVDWGMENLALRPQIYDIGDGKIGYLYAFKNWPAVEDRLERAGIRLAGVLNRALTPAH